MKRRIGIQGFLTFSALILSILLANFVFPQKGRGLLDKFIDSIGIGIILLGFLFRIAARGYKAEKSNNGRNLVTDGPYSLMRHPMYFGTLLIGLGIISILLEWWAFFLFLFVFLLIYVPQIKKEEGHLSKRFEHEYRRYLETTPKYFPNLIGLFKIDLKGYLFFKRPWLRKELPSLIGVLGVIIALKTWECLRLLGCEEAFRELTITFLIAGLVIIVFSKFYRFGKS